MYSSQLVWCLYIILCFSEYKVLIMKVALFLGLYSSQIIECDSTIKSLLSFIDFNRRALSNSRKTKTCCHFQLSFQIFLCIKIRSQSPGYSWKTSFSSHPHPQRMQLLERKHHLKNNIFHAKLCNHE